MFVVRAKVINSVKLRVITYYLKICFYNNELKYEPFWRLSDMRKLLHKKNVRNELKKYLKLDVVDEFIANSDFVDKDKII